MTAPHPPHTLYGSLAFACGTRAPETERADPEIRPPHTTDLREPADQSAVLKNVGMS